MKFPNRTIHGSPPMQMTMRLLQFRTDLVCITLIPLSLITVLFNGLVLYLIYKDPRRELSFPAVKLVMSVCIADFLIGAVLEPLILVQHFIPEGYPGIFEIYESLLFLLATADVLSNCALTIDRYLHISAPLKYNCIVNDRKMKRYTIAIWVYALFIAWWFMLPLFVKISKGAFYTMFFVISLGSIFAPIITMFVTLCKSFLFLRRHRKNLFADSEGSDANQRRLRKATTRDRRVIFTLLIIFVVMCVSFLPIFIAHTINMACEKCLSRWNKYILDVMFLIALTTAVTNSYIFAIRLDKFKAALNIVLKTKRCRKSRKVARLGGDNEATHTCTTDIPLVTLKSRF